MRLPGSRSCEHTLALTPNEKLPHLRYSNEPDSGSVPSRDIQCRFAGRVAVDNHDSTTAAVPITRATVRILRQKLGQFRFHRLTNQIQCNLAQQIRQRIQPCLSTLETLKRYSFTWWRISSGCLFVLQPQIKPFSPLRFFNLAQTPDLSYRLVLPKSSI